MNPEEKRPIDRALEILKRAVQAREEIVVEGFVQLGPDELRKALDIQQKEDWSRFFDYLVLNRDVVKHCVRKYMKFFSNVVAEKGPRALRRIFKIEDAKYDEVFEEIFDLVAVSHGSLFKYVENNRFEFVMIIRQGHADNLRRGLCLDKKRYESLWFEILEYLMGSVCETYYDERAVEAGLQAFTLLMNNLRGRGPLGGGSKRWSFETK